MNLLLGDNLLLHVQNIIHEATQVHKSRIDLTVNSVSRITGAGSLDFGGSEFEPAKTKSVNPQKKHEDDDYGWWDLDAGSYKATLNEQISLNERLLAIMHLHTHARETGIKANTQIIEASGELTMVFEVPEMGCNIKENARFAAVHLFQA